MANFGVSLYRILLTIESLDIVTKARYNKPYL
jgi:hypothetical protein